MTLGISDGERLYAVRYASASEANSLYVSNDARDVQLLHPDNERVQSFSEEDRAIVSEPLEELPGLWREVPASSAIVVQPGADEELAFTPQAVV
jgi:predicted glutamine amidotransferase